MIASDCTFAASNVKRKPAAERATGVYGKDQIMGGGGLIFERRGTRRNGLSGIQKSLAVCGLTGNGRNFGSHDAQIVQFTCIQAAKFVDGVTVTAPVAVRADQVHFSLLKSFSLSCRHHIGLSRRGQKSQFRIADMPIRWVTACVHPYFDCNKMTETNI